MYVLYCKRLMHPLSHFNLNQKKKTEMQRINSKENYPLQISILVSLYIISQSSNLSQVVWKQTFIFFSYATFVCQSSSSSNTMVQKHWYFSPILACQHVLQPKDVTTCFTYVLMFLYTHSLFHSSLE